MPCGTPASSEAVSSVVGTVLMLGITVAVFAGLSVYAIDYLAAGAEAVRADLGVEQKDGRVVLRHRGGDALDLASGRVLLTVAGARAELPLTAFAGQVDDGRAWRIGESLCLAGPPPCLYAAGEVGSVMVAYGNHLVLPEVVLPGAERWDYVDALALAGTGSVAALPAQDADGVEARLDEDPATIPPGTVGPTRSSGTTVLPGGGATNPDAAKASDNVRAVLDADTDVIELYGFDLPADANAVTALSIGFEGRKASAGGNDPSWRLDHKRGETGSYSLGTLTPESSTADESRSRPLCSTPGACSTAGFTVDNVELTRVRLAVDIGAGGNQRNLEVDHVFATVTYTTLAGTVYRMDLELRWDPVADGTAQEVELRYRTATDTFIAEVWDFAADEWRRCIGTLSSTALATFSCPLTADESDADDGVRVRIADSSPAGTARGTLWLDYARVEVA